MGDRFQSDMIDILLVNYNSTDYLLRCLDSLQDAFEGSSGVRIHIHDNASSDGIERIPSRFPHVDFTAYPENIGFAAAINRMILQTAGKYLILLNPDSFIVDRGFLRCIKYLEGNPDVGVLGPCIRDADGCLQHSARSFPTPLTALFGRTSFFSRCFPKNPITCKNLPSQLSDGDTPLDVDWVSGACMVVRRAAIVEVGLLDERFFMYWEDADWCRRMREKGWRVVYYPRAEVYHRGGGSSEKRRFRSDVAFHRSVYRLFEKYLHPSLSIVKPLVLGGLLLRLGLVTFSNLIHRKPVLEPGSDLGSEPIPKRDQRRGSGAKKRIKVVRVISRLNIGGPSIHVSLLTQWLDPRLFDVRLVVGRAACKEGDMGYLLRKNGFHPIELPQLQRPIRLWADLRALFRLYGLICRERPDILATHTAKAGTLARLAGILYNLGPGRCNGPVRMVHTFHGNVFEGYFNRFQSRMIIEAERLMARATDRIVAISSTQNRELAEKYRIAQAPRIETIELGFDLKPFLNGEGCRGGFKKRWGFSPDDRLIGMVGRLVSIKNHRMFFDAASRLLLNHPDLDFRLVVVGDGELRQSLEAYCRRVGLGERTLFCGWVREISEVYADLDLLALTSLNEGTPVSVIESMAAGVPVIATDVGGVRDLLGNPEPLSSISKKGFSLCERGLLCRKGDADGFAEGLAYLLRCEPREHALRVERARGFVKDRYSHQRLLRDMEHLYTSLAQRKSAAGIDKIADNGEFLYRMNHKKRKPV